ncbi:hypothetical protein Taro_009628, partial [Colocasia esculenta]|nr:hypothetical protein [Colocasia esculenta]
NRADEKLCSARGFAVGILRRFGFLEFDSTSFHREDATWSGGNIVPGLFFAFFAKFDAFCGYLFSWEPQVREIRRFRARRPVEGLHHQQCNFTFLLFTSGLRPVRGRQTRVRLAIRLSGLNGEDRHSWYQNKFRIVMAERRELGGLMPELQDVVIPLMCRIVEEAAQRVAILERTVRARQGQSQASGLGSGSFRSRNSSKEAVVEAGNMVFSREVFSRVVAIGRLFQKNLSRVRQGSQRYLHLSDVIIVGSQDI